jgi:hypothetical protein
MESTGFDAMGKPIPANRLDAADTFVKSVFPNDRELSYTIVTKAKNCLERDKPFELLGALSQLDEDLAKLDLTGRYRLAAILLT